MAPKTGNRKSNSKDPADWQKFEFVEIPLNEEEKADFKTKYAKDANFTLGLLHETLTNGYKLSTSWDEGNSCVIASLTCKAPLDVNFNFVLTARAGDVWESVALVLYKHHVLADDNDWGAETRTTSRQWG